MAAKAKWLKERLDLVQALLDKDVPYKDIAKKFNISVKTLYNVIYNHNLQGRNLRY
jgi:transposase